MERLWTPWRAAFVEGSQATSGDAACFLCTKAAEHDDRANLILYRSPSAYVLMNLYPYNNGHLLVAPYAHTGDFAGLEAAIAQDMLELTQRCVGVLQRAYSPDAFNVGMNLGKAAGAGVPDHLHTHVVPRWSGDTNFMPVLAQTKVLPESLEHSYDRLEPLFHA
jgi:ATP adenylyltransferase